jgi:hypothetical protein
VTAPALSRRRALGLALATGGGALLSRPLPGRAADPSDAELLTRAVEIEQRATFAYSEALRALVFDRRTTRLVEAMHEQELEHVEGLGRALRRLGRRPPVEPLELRGLERALAGGQRRFLAFALAREAGAVRFYREALGQLRRPGLLPGVASVMANRGQHMAVLRRALGRDPVPLAVETGEL